MGRGVCLVVAGSQFVLAVGLLLVVGQVVEIIESVIFPAGGLCVRGGGGRASAAGGGVFSGAARVRRLGSLAVPAWAWRMS